MESYVVPKHAVDALFTQELVRQHGIVNQSSLGVAALQQVTKKVGL